ncbi:helix-turn-helix transcriptional regulator [Euryhalocaulis caribicus]|uniref:helix-turn-helix transcriptional regulator n=1 Tax=Euryhalocaulis caribicus TaxID=1161401 RepID=UPI0003B6535E|nr:helix-turn-helix domain-containing protein [Euryhalocaulis caribicus]
MPMNTQQVSRLTTSEVCALARYGKATLWRRIREKQMPPPVDRGRESLFDRKAVEKALGLVDDDQTPALSFNADAYREAESS